MSESEFKKIRLHLRLLTICVLVLIALLTANLIHRNFNPKSTSFPKAQVVSTLPPKVDYGKINELIKSQIAKIPIPQNGANGQSTQGPIGITGSTGKPAPAITSLQISLAVATYLKAHPPKAGKDALPSPVLQSKVDPITCQLQQKYDTNDFWISIAQLPKPCEVL